jgi:CRISPR-associated protein Csb1
LSGRKDVGNRIDLNMEKGRAFLAEDSSREDTAHPVLRATQSLIFLDFWSLDDPGCQDSWPITEGAESVPLNVEQLKELVAGGAVAIRGTATLEPAGGPGDKIFPPTHKEDDRDKEKHGAKYAFETRRIGGQGVTCVLLDSVQSQANRMEEALQALWADRQIVLPVVSVDFSSIAPEVGRVTSLSAPHRIADALLRDSLLDGQLFRLSNIGRSFTDASTKDATACTGSAQTGRSWF